MKFTSRSLLATSGLIAAALPLFAGPVDRAVIVDDPAWVLHVDVDAFRNSAVGKQVVTEMQKPGEALRFGVLQAVIGFDPRTALHGITVYGAGASPEDGVALIFADVDAAKLESLAKQAEDYRSTPHGKHAVLSYIDGGKREKEGGNPRIYAAIYQSKAVIFGQKESRVADALDVLDGLKTSLAKGSSLPKIAASSGGILMASARRLDLPGGDPAAQVFKQAKSIALDLRETGPDLVAHLALDTQDEDSAKRVGDIVRGLVAVIGLQQSNPEAEKLAKALSVDQTGSAVGVALKISSEDVVAAIKAHAAKDETKDKEAK